MRRLGAGEDGDQTDSWLAVPGGGSRAAIGATSQSWASRVQVAGRSADQRAGNGARRVAVIGAYSSGKG